ncbi:DUF294 nucleotidyltransferase-like domain-containing protein [Salirhabdus salicampi]|uniref:DUF294 nucleotidyltransferase-like domain-containing protein n=1 Tax=Salirhabdus salicampi TaxID=476102 RepID=UPI0020C5AF43|nr:DUF294 nucleotidyltransferase-like domain-containing protein [Salirhabdus salicampi]MCP8617255.1 DUF294 nucleotidyltransferase-like domain-containing protein [Salirhabdus salicampi]
MNSYEDIKKWRQTNINTVSTNHVALNKFHDEVMKATISIAIEKVQNEWGNPPAPFAFFLMGSAGRFEQSLWSDQDHGIIFGGSQGCQSYFLRLGQEIVNGLEHVGYIRCDGNVMASNPLWCQSLTSWKQQVSNWLIDANWTSLRHISTFFDSRVLLGDRQMLERIKQHAFSTLSRQPSLYLRLVENVEFMKKGVGVFGQLLPELYGEHTGQIQFKKTTYFPYVNALRLLAIKEEIQGSSTLSRFHQIKGKHPSIYYYEQYFMKLLQFRLHFLKDVQSYSDVHLISVERLTKKEKKELKNLMKKGYELFSSTKKILENECSTW